MKDRLQTILNLEKLTASQLASLLDIQRSTLSNILGGRNKPSFELIRGILTKLPNLNIEWLLDGIGQPYKDSEKNFRGEPISGERATVDETFGQNFGSEFASVSDSDFGSSSGVTDRSGSGGENRELFSDYPTGIENDIPDMPDANYTSFYSKQSTLHNIEAQRAENGIPEREHVPAMPRDLKYDDVGNKFAEIGKNYPQKGIEGQIRQYSHSESGKTEQLPKTPQKPINEAITSKNPLQQLPENRIFGTNCTSARQKKEIMRVILFYSDGSFEDFGR